MEYIGGQVRSINLERPSIASARDDSTVVPELTRIVGSQGRGVFRNHRLGISPFYDII